MRFIFSFEGRLRRLDYIFSFVIVVFLNRLVYALTFETPWAFLLAIPILYFYIAQSTKRFHDLNMSGWWQLIPMAYLLLIFSKGDSGDNQYGADPKSK